MELRALQTESFTRFSLWIIEHVWAHRLVDVQEVVDPSMWPEVDSQPLSLEDSWRLRVASAQVFCIVKNRDVEHFEKVMDFMDDTYRLVPGMVAPIKHMKIMFGLKTMTIMWMLREGRGTVDTVIKINQFFPSKLPQYQGKCSQHELFLMRKNQLDFKNLAQSLVLDKNKLRDYVQNQLEQQYGEHYAQKVEDRLLHYLQKLNSVLPENTYIDKIMKKKSPVSEEEKFLLEIIVSDSTTIAATLKKLLHCDAASCGLTSASQSSHLGQNDLQTSQSLLQEGSLWTNLVSADATIPGDNRVAAFKAGQENNQRVSEDNSVPENDEMNSDVKVASSPQFCSKHRRWVKNILQQCPDECSEELLLQTSVTMSPPLFPSSSSTTTTSSSQDLTPSDLPQYLLDQHHQPSPQTHLQTAAKTCKPANLEENLNSERIKISTSDLLPQPSLSTDALLPSCLSPIVRLVDVFSQRNVYLKSKHHDLSTNGFITSSSKRKSLVLTSGNNRTNQEPTQAHTLDQSESAAAVNQQSAASRAKAAPVSTCRPQAASRLSRRFRRTGPGQKIEVHPTTSQTSCPTLPEVLSVSGPPTGASVATSPSESSSSVRTASTDLPQQAARATRNNIRACRSKSQPHTATSSSSSSSSSSEAAAIPCESSRIQAETLMFSLRSQTLLLQSKLLQPSVSLTRLDAKHCHRVTKGRSSVSVEPACRGSYVNSDAGWRREEEEESDLSFDLNILYSSHSSSSDNDNSLSCDPDYKPRIKKKRLLLDYEAARTTMKK
ncbi:uncharacterized protein V6R79_019634 [Siganus canaliculatus]